MRHGLVPICRAWSQILREAPKAGCPARPAKRKGCALPQAAVWRIPQAVRAAIPMALWRFDLRKRGLLGVSFRLAGAARQHWLFAQQVAQYLARGIAIDIKICIDARNRCRNQPKTGRCHRSPSLKRAISGPLSINARSAAALSAATPASFYARRAACFFCHTSAAAALREVAKSELPEWCPDKSASNA